MRRFRVNLLVIIAVLSLAGCDAVKLREHNLQLDSLLKARAETNAVLREAIRNDSPNALEQQRRLDQIRADLAALALDANNDAATVEDDATKVGYLFTSARAGSKAGPALARVFAERIARARSGESGGSGGGGAAESAEADPVDPLLYGIVIPAREVCDGFTESWQRPARDCAYMEVVGYFAAVDDLVASGQFLEDNKGKLDDGAERPLGPEDADGIFAGLARQFDNIREARTSLPVRYKGIDPAFRRYLDIQLIRTFCSAQLMQISFGGDAARVREMKDFVTGLGDGTLKNFVIRDARQNIEGPDCGKVREQIK